MALKSGILYTTSENGEGYLACRMPGQTVFIGATAMTTLTSPGRRLPATRASSAPFEMPHSPTFSYPLSCSSFAADVTSAETDQRLFRIAVFVRNK